MARKLSPQTEKIRGYLAQGMQPKDIAKKMKIPRQRVYNVQYQARKQDEQLIPVKPKGGGIGSVKAKQRASAGTGITSLTRNTGTESVTITPNSPLKYDNVVTPKPTLWERFKRFISWQ